MKSLAYTTKDVDIRYGLGQVIKDYAVREWWNIDFCSKFCLHASDRSSYDGWYIFRDPNKFVLQKQFYVG